MIKPPPLSNDCFALPRGVNWTPVATALDHLRQNMRPICAARLIGVANGMGRVLADPIVARADHPPFANAAVDGFGFAHASLPPPTANANSVVLPLVGETAAAGQVDCPSVPAGSAIAIMTGAALPDGVDTIVLQEDVTQQDHKIAFHTTGLRCGANTRPCGEDIALGQSLFDAGHKLRANDLGVLASARIEQLCVYDRLRVGVLSNGDELINNHIPDANRPALLALLRGWGHDVIDLGIAPDDRDKTRAILDDAAMRCDAILTSGGASAGAADHISALLNANGTLHHWRIALKPGRPLALGQWQNLPVFGLPGNPVAAFVCACLFAHPALAVLSGQAWPDAQLAYYPAAFAKDKKAGRNEYLRARLNHTGQVEIFKSEGSGRVTSLSFAQGLVHLGPDARQIAPGDLVAFQDFATCG